MNKYILSILTSCLLSFSLLSPSILAKDLDNVTKDTLKEQRKAQVQEIFNQKLSKDEIEKAMKKFGWKNVSQESSDEISTEDFSAAQCMDVFAEAWEDQHTGIYVIRADWDFDVSSLSCTWGSNVDKVDDILELHVVNTDGEAVNQQPENATIYAYDEDNDFHDVAAPFKPGSSSYAFQIDDSYGSWSGDRIGENGWAYFFIDEPTNSSNDEYHVRAVWHHNWADTNISINGVNFTYSPPAMGITWSTTSTLVDKQISDQIEFSTN